MSGEEMNTLYKEPATAPARSHRFNKKKIFIGVAIFILILFFVFFILYMGRGAAGAYNSIFGGIDSESSDKECILPPNMKWKGDIKRRRKVGDSISITEITSEAVCIDPDFIPSPSKGHIYCPPK